MSPVYATFAALLIYALGLVPFLWMAVRAGSGRWLGGLCGALILGIALVQTGIFQRDSLAPVNVVGLAGAGATAGRCQQVFDVLLDAGVLLERPGPRTLVVRGDAWAQLGPPVRDAVMACARDASGTENANSEIEVIER